MRVALLSLTDAVAGDPQTLRGGLTIGGRSIVRHQMGIALALGCARVVLLTEALSGEVLALQQTAEAGGARFHVITTAHALLPLVNAEDELIVLADGLLAMPAEIMTRLGEAPGVLALPVEIGTAAGFERIDINHASAGAMRLPGRLVAGLGDLPSDWNANAALLRLAVQGRCPLRLLPEAVLRDGRWGLVRSEDEAQRVEPAWLRLHTATNHVRTPGEWLAARLVQVAGPALLHAGTRPWVVVLGALVALLLAIGSGWFGWRTPGFALLGLAWVLALVATLLARIERASLLESGRAPGVVHAAWAIDAAIVVLAAWRSEIPPLAGVPFAAIWFPPAVFVLQLRLLARVLPVSRWVWWLEDRLVVALGFAVVSALLPFDFCLRAGVLGLAVLGLVLAPRRAESTNSELTEPA